jgi:lauroyl/myristoyl acyltransferase
MTGPAALSLAYRLSAGAGHVRKLLPRRWTEGAPTGGQLAALGDDPLFRDTAWSKRILASQFRCEILRRFAETASLRDLDAFCERKVVYETGFDFARLRQLGRPLILATPHYGAYVMACMVALGDFGDRPVNIFYEDPARNPANAQFEAIFRRRPNAKVLLNGRRGVIAAIKALRNNECLTMMPDVYLDVDDTIAVPFFGRLMRAMTGTAFFALHADALVAPVYVLPDDRFGIRIRISEPLDPRACRAGDEAQKLFRITRDLFADMERTFRRAPEHWVYWRSFGSLSSESRRAAPDAGLRGELQQRLRVVPFLARRVPALVSSMDDLADRVRQPARGRPGGAIPASGLCSPATTG